MGTIKEATEEAPKEQIGATNGFITVNGYGSNGVVVQLNGEIYGPFEDSATALAWSYQVARGDIFQMKTLLNPHLLME